MLQSSHMASSCCHIRGRIVELSKIICMCCQKLNDIDFFFARGEELKCCTSNACTDGWVIILCVEFSVCICLWWWFYGEIFFFIVKVSLMNFFIFYSSHQRERESPPLNLFTCVLGDDFFARVTANTAAPLELAITLLLNNNLLCIVASAAAEQWAAVESCRCLAAFPAMRACNHRVFFWVEVWKGWRKSWRDVKHSPVHCSCLFTLHQSGDSSRYTKSNAVGTLKRESLTCKRPRLFILTCVACSYFSRRKSPETSSKLWMELRNTTTDREWDCSRFFTRTFGFCSRNTKLTYFSNCT